MNLCPNFTQGMAELVTPMWRLHSDERRRRETFSGTELMDGWVLSGYFISVVEGQKQEDQHTSHHTLSFAHFICFPNYD